MQTKQRLDVPLSLKSVSDSGEFEGYGSVFGVKDSHDDVVMSGAFAASLRAWSDRKALPALLWQHRMDEPIGVYTEMKEDDVGLYVRGRLTVSAPAFCVTRNGPDGDIEHHTEIPLPS